MALTTQVAAASPPGRAPGARRLGQASWAPLLAALVAGVLAQACLAAVAPAAASTPATYSYQPKGAQSMCSYTTFASTALNCDDNSAAGAAIKVPRGAVWQQYCADACAALTLAGTPCYGIVYRGPRFNVKSFTNQCIFRGCTGDAGGSLDAVKNDVTALVLNTPSCLDSPAPTQAPVVRSTAQPSYSPVRRVRTNTPRPTPQPGVLLPGGVPATAPFDASRFSRVSPDTSLCVVARGLPPLLGQPQTLTFPNWTGTQTDCLRICAYDPLCHGSMYSPVLKTCVKTTGLQTYDSSADVATYVSQGWLAWTLDNYQVPYINMYCEQYSWSVSCNSDPQCTWNGGLKGSNDIRAYNRGYCGRIACSAGISP